MTCCFLALRCLHALLPPLRKETIPVKFVGIVKREGTKEKKEKTRDKILLPLDYVRFFSY